MATTERSTDIASRRAQRHAIARGVRTRRWRGLPRAGALHLLVGGVGVVFAFPFVWMLMISTRPDADIFRFPPALIPHQWALYNYVDAFRFIPYLLYTYNTALIAGLNVVGTVISCSLSAYAFSRVQ